MIRFCAIILINSFDGVLDGRSRFVGYKFASIRTEFMAQF